ncbi:MAG: nitroreductase family protein [Candidatus Bathyarchaeota archaeon]|nr:MAG: nitroreductase family protein [Candidatus Bathyarchaeota archaeon]
MENPVLNAIRERRSTVRFKSAPVDEEKIQKILEAGRWAPSYLNSQPWEFLILTDPEVKRQLCQIGVKITLFSEGIETASAVIVIVVDPRKDPSHYIEDGSAATQNMALAAHSLGLATYWIGILDLQKRGKTTEEAVKELLGIPKVFRVIALLPIGVPAYEEHSDRKKMSDIVHRDKYGEV